MPRGALAGVPARLWRLVALAPHRLLMLDYDGTLAPFRVERMEAAPPPDVLDVLRLLARRAHTRLAIVSGRPLAELLEFLGDLPVTLVGGHGWERRDPDGTTHRRELDADTRRALADAQRIAGVRGWSGSIERKYAAIVLHTRGLLAERAAQLERECGAAWAPLTERAPLALESMDGGVELRARDCHKGLVATALLDGSPAGTLGVFVGDDLTDEDAFEALADRGFGVRVGGDDRPSRAMASLPGSAAVAVFLEEWLRLCDSLGPGPGIASATGG